MDDKLEGIEQRADKASGNYQFIATRLNQQPVEQKAPNDPYRSPPLNKPRQGRRNANPDLATDLNFDLGLGGRPPLAP